LLFRPVGKGLFIIKQHAMKLFFSFVFALLAFTTCTKPDKEVYIFTSHREPALDGLHYLYSYDGYHWDSIAGSWLKPEIGNKTPYYNYFTKQTEEQKYAPNSMMRDPSIIPRPRISKRLLRQRHFMIPDLILLTDL